MFKKSRLVLFTLLIFLLNILIYFRASLTIEDVDMVFAECARNSGRTAAALNLMILFTLGFFGLKIIYQNENFKRIFILLFSLFAINHLIHFFFVSQHFKIHLYPLDISHHLHGFITYLSIILVPIILNIFKNLNKFLYAVIIIHVYNVTYFICISFYGRVKPIDPAYMHQIGVLIMIVSLIYVMYKVVKENLVKELKN